MLNVYIFFISQRKCACVRFVLYKRHNMCVWLYGAKLVYSSHGRIQTIPSTKCDGLKSGGCFLSQESLSGGEWWPLISRWPLLLRTLSERDHCI